VPVSPATLRLVDPSGVDAATVVVPGEGTWTVDGAPVVPPTPIVTLSDVVAKAPAGAPAVFDLPAAVPNLVPESVALGQPNQTPADVVTTDDGTWQIQAATGQVTFTPSPTLVCDPAPLTFAAERTDGTAVTGHLGDDYAAAAGPAPTPTPTAGVGAAASSGALAFTGSDAGVTSAAAFLGADALLPGLGLTIAGRRRLRR